MLQQISALPLAAWLAVTGFFRGVKKDVRGLSGVVVAILLILIAVLAVVLVWMFLSDWLVELWERITSETAAL